MLLSVTNLTVRFRDFMDLQHITIWLIKYEIKTRLFFKTLTIFQIYIMNRKYIA